MKRILIADESALSAKIIENIITSPEREISRASDGIETLLSAYREIPDCIILSSSLPLLSGTTTASIIQSRRGINSIPLILITSSPIQPGEKLPADAAVCRDETLKENLISVYESLKDKKVDNQLIKSEASSINRDKIIEIVIQYLEEIQKASSVMDALGDISRECMESPDETLRRGLALLSKHFGAHCLVVLLEQWKRPMAYIHPENELFRSDLVEFIAVCLNDFYSEFSGLNFAQMTEKIFNIDHRDDFERVRIDSRRISSYFSRNLKGSSGRTIGTIHLGHFANNFYTGEITERLNRAIDRLARAVDNALKFSIERETRQKIHHVFSKFVPEEIITGLLTKESDAELMVGEKRNIVVLFSDIRSFTTITETNRPEDVVAFLNNYFDIQVSIIKKFGGTIDKFIGDAIFAIFGAPISYEDNVQRAVNAAINMIQSLPGIDVSHMNIPGAAVKIGIGLHEGDAIVGNIGSSTKFDYTAIGDTVNLAARLEGYTKFYGREILLTDEVKSKLSREIQVREVDLIKAKGKDIATSIFAVETDPRIIEPEYMAEYAKAFRMYKLGNFTLALELFRGLQLVMSEDPVVKIFIERCRDFITNPPENWDGSLALAFK